MHEVLWTVASSYLVAWRGAWHESLAFMQAVNEVAFWCQKVLVLVWR
jgi:hypothetical protein